MLGSPIFESKSCFYGRRPIAESQELQWRSISSCSFLYLREKASEKSKYIARSEINTYRTSCNRAMTLSFSLRVTNRQIVHTAFPFFLARHLYTRASRPQHLSSAIFLLRAHGLLLDADRSPNAVRFHVGTTKVEFDVDRPPPENSPPGDIVITMVKETEILYKKRVSKNEKKSYLSSIWKWWKREMTARLPVTVSSVQTWFYM